MWDVGKPVVMTNGICGASTAGDAGEAARSMGFDAFLLRGLRSANCFGGTPFSHAFSCVLTKARYIAASTPCVKDARERVLLPLPLSAAHLSLDLQAGLVLAVLELDDVDIACL